MRSVFLKNMEDQPPPTRGVRATVSAGNSRSTITRLADMKNRITVTSKSVFTRRKRRIEQEKLREKEEEQHRQELKEMDRRKRALMLKSKSKDVSVESLLRRVRNGPSPPPISFVLPQTRAPICVPRRRRHHRAGLQEEEEDDDDEFDAGEELQHQYEPNIRRIPKRKGSVAPPPPRRRDSDGLPPLTPRLPNSTPNNPPVTVVHKSRYYSNETNDPQNVAIITTTTKQTGAENPDGPASSIVIPSLTGSACFVSEITTGWEFRPVQEVDELVFYQNKQRKL